MNNINDYVNENGELTSEFYSTVSKIKDYHISELSNTIDSLLNAVSTLNTWVLEYRDMAHKLKDENDELKEEINYLKEELDKYDECIDEVKQCPCGECCDESNNTKEETLEDLINMFTAPNYAKLNKICTGDCVTPSVSNKKPVNQCILINGKLAVYESQVKDFLEKSGIKFMSNDTFNSIAKELIGF